VEPGQTVPVDSRLEPGSAEFSLASINGESAPRVFHAGQRVPAGAVLLSRLSVPVTALQAWNESLLARLLRPAEREADRDPLLERIIRGYLIGIFVVAIGSGIAWAAMTGDPARTWAVVIAVLVVSCPCAIGLSVPLAAEMATVALRRRGVFVREAGLFARLRRVRRVIFDKTGTLTLEAPVLQDPEALAALPTEEQAALLALVRDNPHPVAQALAAPLLARGVVPADLGDVRETVGSGIEAGDWSLGREGWRNPRPQAAAEPATVLARAGRAVARFHFKDALRSDARAVVEALAARGLPCSILSGDNRAAVARLAAQLGLPPGHAEGELSPQDKAERAGAGSGGAALMLGDGANDSLAFDRALCRGTPVVHRGVLADKADFYYLGRGLAGVAALFRVNDARRRTQAALLIFSVAYNLLAVGLAVTGHMNPLIAAVLMPLSSLASLAIVGIGMRRVWAGPHRGAV
jgi:Cu2+-exporting ATPase